MRFRVVVPRLIREYTEDYNAASGYEPIGLFTSQVRNDVRGIHARQHELHSGSDSFRKLGFTTSSPFHQYIFPIHGCEFTEQQAKYSSLTQNSYVLWVCRDNQIGASRQLSWGKEPFPILYMSNVHTTEPAWSPLVWLCSLSLFLSHTHTHKLPP